MRYDEIVAATSDFLVRHPQNFVSAEDAMREDLVGLQLFDAPIFAAGAADDGLFAALRNPAAVHPDYMQPDEWLPGATRVIAFFAPFTARVRQANRLDRLHPADEWRHARIEGEEVLSLTRLFLQDMLREAGYEAVAPLHDARFGMLAKYAANWSERHTAYVCGLGTFGMSKGLLTAKGVAGRFGSVITTCGALPVTARAYQGIYDYCSACGACAVKCPANAIDKASNLNEAKSHPVCEAYVARSRNEPPKGASRKQRYGCGKCQVGVPCEQGIPPR